MYLLESVNFFVRKSRLGHPGLHFNLLTTALVFLAQVLSSLDRLLRRYAV